MLRYRIVSALVLVPLALLTVYVGPPLINCVVALGAALMIWEWDRLSDPSLSRRARGSLVAIVAISMLLTIVSPVAGPIPIVALVVYVRGWSVGQPLSRMAWSFAGSLWLVGACASFIWLRNTPHGSATTTWAFLLVWAEDTAALTFGRLIGGPRLAPQVSPNKTWAGLAGGVAAAVLVSIAFAAWTDPSRPLRLVFASVCLAILEQMGDMAESHAKRRFGVKDSSGLIPGHGGLLDRLDGMMAVVYGLLLLELFGAEAW